MKIISKQIIVILEIVFIGVLLFLPLFISLHAVPAADDFSRAVDIERIMSNKNASLYIIEIFDLTLKKYMEWGGYFFSFFLTYLLIPDMSGSLLKWRLLILLINIIFYGSLWCLVHSSLKQIYKITNLKIQLGIYALILLVFVNNPSNSEVLTWNCVLGAYVLVMACLFWSIIFFIKALYKNKVRWIILTSILGFLTGGGPLNIAVLNCGIFFLIGIFGGVKRIKISVICFTSTFVGTLINVLAPGNYIRHEIIMSDYPVVTALRHSITLCTERLNEIIFYSPFILILVILFVISLKFIKEDTDFNYPIPFGIMGFLWLGIIIVNYPVCLGYGGYFPERCIWVEDCAIYLGGVLLAFYFAGWVRKRNRGIEIQNETILCLTICCILFLCSFGNKKEFNSYPIVMMGKEIAGGQVKEYAQYWEDILYVIDSQ